MNETAFLAYIENMFAYLSEPQLFTSCDHCLQVLETLFFIDSLHRRILQDRNAAANEEEFHESDLSDLLSEFFKIAFKADHWLFAAKLIDVDQLKFAFENVHDFKGDLRERIERNETRLPPNIIGNEFQMYLNFKSPYLTFITEAHVSFIGNFEVIPCASKNPLLVKYGSLLSDIRMQRDHCAYKLAQSGKVIQQLYFSDIEMEEYVSKLDINSYLTYARKADKQGLPIQYSKYLAYREYPLSINSFWSVVSLYHDKSKYGFDLWRALLRCRREHVSLFSGDLFGVMYYWSARCVDDTLNILHKTVVMELLANYRLVSLAYNFSDDVVDLIFKFLYSDFKSEAFHKAFQNPTLHNYATVFSVKDCPSIVCENGRTTLFDSETRKLIPPQNGKVFSLGFREGKTQYEKEVESGAQGLLDAALPNRFALK